MNIAESSIKRAVTTVLFIIVLSGAGYISYWKLGWLEDPVFTIKDAMIYTYYPGATAYEVEQEVTNTLEDSIQELKELKRLQKSISMPGLSIIDAQIQDKFSGYGLKQIWDQLRHKIRDNQYKLPPGCQTPIINDDFGDVYGVMYAIIGDGFTWREMKDYADYLRKRLLRVEGVAKVVYWGVQQEAIYIELSRAKLSELKLSPSQITQAVTDQNLVTQSGQVMVDSDYVWIFPSGEFSSVESIADLIIRDQKSGTNFRIGDVATVKRGYVEPSSAMMSFSGYENDDAYVGKPCMAICISPRDDANVVNMGEALKKELEQLEDVRPYGMEMRPIVFQGDAVKKSINNFIVNLGESVAIVILVLLIFMGLRSGFIIGSLLLFIVAATFVCMYIQGITLQRISLGALIIALGMLVDNGIVIADGMLVNIQRGIDKIKAAGIIVKQTTLPLLAGTIVGILAFSAIGLSPDSTGEYCGSLFWVICFSMLWSWVMAITVVPLLGFWLYKSSNSGKDTGTSGEVNDPYDTVFYRFYRKILTGLVNHRWIVLMIMIGLLAVAGYGFKFVKRSFFPESDSPRFYIDFWDPQGTDIRVVDKQLKEISAYLTGIDEKTGKKRFPDIRYVSTYAGSGAPRFTLTYSAQTQNTSYGFVLIELTELNQEVIGRVAGPVNKYLEENFPNALGTLMKFKMGASYDATIEARFFGDDADKLRELAQQAIKIMNDIPEARSIRNNWRTREKISKPVFSEARARFAGISRNEMANALQMTFVGQQAGLYRERNNLIPIIARPTLDDRDSIDDMYYTPVWSSQAGTYVPIQQIVSGFETEWQDTVIYRRYGMRCMTAQCEPIDGVTGPELLSKIKDKIEAIKLPDNYSLEWGGQYESSNEANAGLMKTLPISFLLMGMIVVILYDAVKQALIIYLTVPLAIIGVTVGLLVTGIPFGFMSLLGFLSLSGMMIKNAIVLVDQIDQDRAAGKNIYQAILDSGVSRVRPVALGACTTVMGMIPLLTDPFFQGMAVTIVFGLSFATVLTLLICPVIYATFFQARED